MANTTNPEIKRGRMLRIPLIIVLLAITAYAGQCAYNIYKLSKERTVIRSEYAEVNNIVYGLLSVDAWKKNIQEIVTEKIDQFNFTKGQEDTLKQQVNGMLNALITQAMAMVNEKQTTFSGKLKKFAVNTFVDVDKIRKRVPEFSQTIINKIKDPNNKESLKNLAKTKINEIATETHDSILAQSEYDKILARHHVTDVVEFNKSAEAKIQSYHEQTYYYTYILIGIVFLFLIGWICIRKAEGLYTPMFTFSVILAIIVLCVGLTSAMIEIDVRIKELNFFLVGKNIIFKDQVLYYQSKSILDVVHILLYTGKYDSILVGVLILIFSVVFPFVKLICTKVYLLGNDAIKRNKIIYFFAFKSGKWSMADVMVVAIFMTYTAFKGILDTQMKVMNVKSDTLDTITTNETALQPGFLLFVTYVIFGLILSTILKNISTKPDLLPSNPKEIK